MTIAAAALLLSGCGGTAKTTSTRPSAPSTGAPSTPSSNAPAPAGTNVVTGSSDGVVVTMHAGTHRPKVNAPWPLRFTVTDRGRPAAASVDYEFLFAGQVVARRSHYTFRGRFSDVANWPASAVGYPLTFRAAIIARGVHINLDYPVQVVR